MTDLTFPAAGYEPQDDLRHRPAPGGRMRDSLFWEMMMPDEELGMQVYLYVTDRGKAGFNVAVWGPDKEPVALVLEQGEVPDEADFDDFSFAGLTLAQPELRKTAELRFSHPDVSLEFNFEALHDAFSYRQNPGGLPSWFATNRFEQTGHVTGFLEVGGRRIEWDRTGHRDHSWGRRNWGYPHHWKWFIAYTADGTRIVNGWIWIAEGEWGFGGYVVKDGVLVPVERIEHHGTYDDAMLQQRLEATMIDIGGGATELTIDCFGVVKLPTNDRMKTIILEGAGAATIDGAPAGGQFETLWPVDYLEHLAAARRK